MQFSKKWIASLLTLALPYFAHAEAFKGGGLLSSGIEKALYFIFLVLLLGICSLFIKLLLKFFSNSTTASDSNSTNSGVYFILIMIGTVLFLALVGSGS